MRSTMKTVALMAALIAAPALANDSAATPAATSAAPSGDAKSKLICRKAASTGTRLKARRICYTAEQWTTVNREAREQLKESRSAGAIGAN